MDIDIDFQSSFDPRSLLPQAIPASRVHKGELVKHPCGFYFQNVAVDDQTGLSAIPYEPAEQEGYIKIDFLHLSLLDEFKSKNEIRRLMQKQPKWELLQDPEHVSTLFQIHKHADLLSRVKPSSVEELADCIALIRPGKKHLLEQYLKDKRSTRAELYRKDTSGYYFKRSHAISYALTIVLQLHMIERRMDK